MDSNNPSKPSVSFAGFVCFWSVSRGSGESTRNHFFSIYEDLRQTVQQLSSGPSLSGRKWKVVRISEAGKKFLGLVRR